MESLELGAGEVVLDHAEQDWAKVIPEEEFVLGALGD